MPSLLKSTRWILTHVISTSEQTDTQVPIKTTFRILSWSMIDTVWLKKVKKDSEMTVSWLVNNLQKFLLHLMNHKIKANNDVAKYNETSKHKTKLWLILFLIELTDCDHFHTKEINGKSSRVCVSQNAKSYR